MASSNQGIGIAVALVLGALGGWTLGRMARERPREATAATPAPAAKLAPDTPRSELTSVAQLPAVQEPGSRERTAVTEGLPLIHAGLQEYGRAGIRRGWQTVRGSDIPDAILAEGSADYEKLVRESPEQIGQKLGQREDERDAALADAATGGVFALLASLQEGKAGPLTEITTSPAAFGEFFVRASPETSKNGLGHLERLDLALEDGVTLSFPAGVFAASEPLPRGDDIPRDVTLEGAGMDATLLLIDEFFASGRLRNLTLRNCTILTTNYLFDIRGAFSSIQLDRVRITGFDKGSGSSCIFGTDGTAIYARNSRFEGGYGRSPRSGQLFDERSDALLARFEGCTFEHLRIGTDRLRPGASVVFANCRMTGILDRTPPEETEHRGILFPDTVVDLHDWSGGEPLEKDLNELFPDWEARINQ